MTSNESLTALWERPAEKQSGVSPFIIEFFMVQCTGFRGMAYEDRNGVWRSAFENEELTGDIYILE